MAPGAKRPTLKLATIIGLLLAIIIVSVGVAVTYFYFEAAVRHSINFIWESLIDTDNTRLLVIPLCVVISLAYFWLQHHFDPRSEKHESRGLGQAPPPTVVNFIKVLGIGFFSLIAGASLGPEAILVPACLLIGAYVGTKFFKATKQAPKLLSMVGFVALMAAFFNSFLAGMLGLLLVTKEVGIKVNAGLIVIAGVASAVTVMVLGVLSAQAFTTLPRANWEVSVASVIALPLLFALGYATPYGLRALNDVFRPMHATLLKREWWFRGFFAAAGLSALYLLGGPLVEFTGNESIVPMLEKAGSLGLVGLLWLLLVKLSAISWSKTFGYRGGLVFPTVFVASVLVAIIQHYSPSTSFVVGLIIVMAGVIAADRKAKILF